ncbi:MAG: ATP-binding cassette domain-containing protein [Beijerinckiaceae bacterium]|nr:ATP-binding cassette domain-containing protein [Beijerinckiaceae bacterium]
MTPDPAPPTPNKADASEAKASDVKSKDRVSLTALKPLLPFATRYKARLAAALVALVVASGATLVIPMAVRRMIDYGFTAEGAGLIDRYFGMMIVVVGVLAAASATRYYLVMTIGERVVADVRSALFSHLLRLDAGFYDNVRAGELVSRMSSDTTLIKSAFGASASIALRNFVLFVGALALMIYTSPHLSGLVLVTIPFIVLPLVASGRSVRRRTRLAQDRLADASAYATEAIGATRVMQAFNAQRDTSRHFAEASENAYITAREATGARSILTAVAIFLIFASVVGVLWWGAQDVLSGKMTGGELSQFVLYAVFGAGALGELSQVWGEISAASGAASRLAELLEIKPAITAPKHPKPFPVPPEGTVRFDDVTFAYPTRTDVDVLKGLSFAMKKGERIALVGPSGAGKSTIAQLILRFYDPQKGHVRVDDVILTEADPEALRDRIAFVPQEAVIFGTTIAENIAYGQKHASREAIKHAADLAAASEFIEKLPEGYDTLVGERGVTLSGGQRQRIAIARAILRDAPILLLDEATSALDAENERLVQAALDRLMEGRTTLVIAHRLATILKADRILVIDGGRIVEEGDHATLVAKNGLYARLARLQFGHEMAAE